MNFLVSEQALIDLEEIVVYYNDQSPGLGFEFAAETRSAFARIKEFPLAWSSFSKTSRRCMLSRFPYGVLFSVTQESINVVAIMHLRRHPRKWRSRLSV